MSDSKHSSVNSWRPDCPKCGAFLVLRERRGDDGYFFGCGTYPKCKFTESYDQGLEELRGEIEDVRGRVVETHRANRGLERRLRSFTSLGDDLTSLIYDFHPDRNHSHEELANRVTASLIELRDRVRGED